MCACWSRPLASSMTWRPVCSPHDERIVASVREEGMDAWSNANKAAFLGPDHDPDEFEINIRRSLVAPGPAECGADPRGAGGLHRLSQGVAHAQ